MSVYSSMDMNNSVNDPVHDWCPELSIFLYVFCDHGARQGHLHAHMPSKSVESGACSEHTYRVFFSP